jgi:hypothetical protein
MAQVKRGHLCAYETANELDVLKSKNNSSVPYNTKFISHETNLKLSSNLVSLLQTPQLLTLFC